MYDLCTHTTCLSCYDDINENNFVLYQINEDNNWKSCFYCCECIKYMLETKWTSFMKMLEELDCKATFKRILDEGVPNLFRDIKLADTEITKFYFEGEEQSSKYKNPYTQEKIDKVLYSIQKILDM